MEYPEKLRSDRDPIFMKNLRNLYLSHSEQKRALSWAYHPKTYGQSEIVKIKVEETIRGFVNCARNNWDKHIVDIEVA